MEGIDAGSLGVWPRSDEVDQGGEKTPGVFDERMVNFNVLQQRSPTRGPRPRDITSQTRTPATPGAVSTDQAVTSKRKPNDLFAIKWLRAPATIDG
jgi:hypothetical protein